jgi:hypothetical protein
MILRKGISVLVNANIGHPPVRPYIVTLVNSDTVFLEGWWDRLKNQPLHVPKDWLWPILIPGEKVAVRLPASDQSPLADTHLRNAGIWTVYRTEMYGDFLSTWGRDGLPCAVRMVELDGGNLFDPRFLDDPADLAVKPDAAALRIANTKPDAKFCAACGGPLKAPQGLGPEYQHCPRCEP